MAALQLLQDISADDYAYMNLRYFSEHCWRGIAGQVKNGAFHDEWYELLGKEDRPSRLHIQSAREHAKTTCLSVKYPLWRVGRDPNLRVMIVSKSATLATSILREIQQNIESNRQLQQVFPALKPDSPWSASELQVKRTRGVILKDPTFVGVGLHGPLTGKRADLIIIDDPFDESEVRTEAQRKKVEDWIEKVLLPTLTPNGELVAVGCLVAGTKVLMADGTWKNIEDVVVGESVVSYDSIEKVEAMIPQGVADVYEVKTSNNTLEGTPNHPFLVLDEGGTRWTKLEDLNIGDKLVSFRCKLDGENPKELTEEELWILGFMLGDGWITHHPNKKGSMRWLTCFATGVYDDINARVKSFFENKFDMKMHYRERGRYYYTEVARVGRYLEEMGFKGNAKTKRIPEYVFTLPLNLRHSFLDGFVAADGHTNKDGFKTIELCNEKLIKDLQLLIVISGFKNNNIYERSRMSKPPNSHDEFMSKSYHVGFGKVFHEKHFAFSRVRSIKYVGKKEVYDLTISNTKNFVAEGLVVHNTPWHYDDYWSRLEGKSIENDGKYVVLKYPAIKNFHPDTPVEEWEVQWPQVWSAERLAERKKEIGTVKFGCLYLLDPSGFEGALFKREWLTFFDPSIFNDSGYVQDFEYYMAVDPNVSDNPESARCAIVTIAFDRRLGDIYVLDVYAEPLDFPSQMKKIIEYAKKTRLPFMPWDVKIRQVGIEANTWQQIVSKAAYAAGLPIKEIKQKQTKHERLVGIAPHFENHRIKFPHPKYGVNWWEKFESEYLSYPMGKYKDIMDGIELAFTTADISRGVGEPNFAFGDMPRWGGMR
jgi:predicted phage terminase large subunit-like protein